MTDKILPRIEDWQNRPLDEVYPILYIDAIHYSVRDNGVIRKLAAYVILGINTEGKKEVLTISVGDNESAKYWLSVMNELKKSWSQRCINHLCRWFNRHQRSNRCCFSKNRVSALYRTPGKKHTEICP